MARNRFDVDENLETPFNWDQVKRVGQYVTPYTKKLGRVMLVMVLSQALALLNPMFVQQALDVAIPGANVPYLILLSTLYFVGILVVLFAARYRIKHLTDVGQDIVHDIRYEMFEHMQHLPFTYFDSRPHGKISTRILNYVNTVSDLLSNVLVNTVLQVITLLIIVVYMLIVDWRLTIYALIGLPVLIIYIMMIKGVQRRAQQVQNNKSSNLNAYAQESVQGMKITQLFGREAVNRQIYHGLGTQFRKSVIDVNLPSFSLNPAVEIISNFIVGFLYVAAVFWLRQENGQPLEPGTIVAFVSYIGYFWNPIAQLANFYNQLLNGASYVERIFEMLDEPLVIENAPDAYDLGDIEGEVKFDHVDFGYEAGVDILKDVNFTIKPGQTIALVGPTGAGKTTIVNLISRFYDTTDGHILIDGHKIKDVTVGSLRSQMGIMMQDPYLFPTTIRENIRYGRMDATDEEVEEAAKSVHAHEFIMRQPEAYDTVIQERGAGVSAGEMQLISIARVMLANPKLIILDEATSSIDTQTEQALQLGIDELTKGRTTFTIAHRLSTIRNADRIFYIANQGIAEDGNHEELLAKGGLYASLYEQQIKEMIEAGAY